MSNREDIKVMRLLNQMVAEYYGADDPREVDSPSSYSPIERVIELGNALHKNEFMVVYQPKLKIPEEKLTGVEALLRWRHPERGLVTPDRIISLAEKTGLIVQIGEWVMRTAFSQLKTWHKKGLDIKISINISPRQIFESSFIKKVKSIIEEYEIPTCYIEFEVTEGITLDIEQILGVLQQVKELGIRISLDDFGTGYNSLYYLKQLPVDTLKIDQNFVRECTNNHLNATIVKTIIYLAQNLNLQVVAEGVETREQLHFLKAHACNEVQGYLFSKPVNADHLELIFRKWA